MAVQFDIDVLILDIMLPGINGMEVCQLQEREKGMWLNVWKKNERAIRFYEKQGFETVGESEFRLTETHANPNWVMLLRYGGS